jgi:ABC-2 type transport system ATP-binding protein
MTTIELIDLKKYFRGVQAVDGISLRVRGGTLFGFLGPNGSGKTTTLKMMAGVLKPTRGRILIGGRDIAEDPVTVKQKLAFIPDHPFVYEKLTAVEFLHFMADLYALDKDVLLDHEIERLLTLFQLDGWGNDLVGGYSHGMKQRLVLCAALLHRPEVLIVDEPMVGLDPGGTRLVKDIFKKETAKGTTVFMATHSLEVAEEVCDEIAIIQAGKIRAQGSSDDLKAEAGVDGNLESIFLRLTEKNSKPYDVLYSPET